ncbi:MAG: type II toxin-antitoxin system VapC family toxin [Phycisphaerae bacterium]|nr:type II toxin-antitoxin system VapC family toxin [Phycisphaerae bacterium]
MEEKVYIETSFISFLTAQPSSDIHQMSRQIESQQWWDSDRKRFDLFTSDAVVREASKGDPVAAQRRLAILETLTALQITPEAVVLSQNLIGSHLLPENASEDALHIALCACHGMDFLLTWNCKHLANAVICRNVYHYLNTQGFQSPVICTPFELMEK